MDSDVSIDRTTPPIDPRFSTPDTLFFVIGAQKSGTTWLKSYLSSHPEVSVPVWKEHNYWNMVEGSQDHPGRMLVAQRDLRANESAFRRFLRKQGFLSKSKERERAITLALRAAETPIAPFSGYADVLLENYGNASKAAGEICPQYAHLRSDTFEKMAALSPNVRFVYLMRDPVERFISGVRHGIKSTIGKDGVTLERLTAQTVAALENSESTPARLSRYEDVMDRLESAVPEDRIAYFFYESFFEQEQIARLCAFLGVSYVEAETEKHVHVGVGKDVDIDDAMRLKIARVLAPTYRRMREKFGDRLPDKWRTADALDIVEQHNA